MRQAFKLIAGSSIERPCADANNSILRQKTIFNWGLGEAYRRLLFFVAAGALEKDPALYTPRLFRFVIFLVKLAYQLVIKFAFGFNKLAHLFRRQDL